MSFLQKHKATLYNIGAGFGYIEKALFLWHGIDSVFITKKQVSVMVTGIVVAIIVAKLCTLPYKWDKPLIRINTLVSISVYVVALILYIVSYFLNV